MITKTKKRFENGRFNYSIKYWQEQMQCIDEITGETSLVLFHTERVKYFELPFNFGEHVQWEQCNDTANYYRQ